MAVIKAYNASSSQVKIRYEKGSTMITAFTMMSAWRNKPQGDRLSATASGVDQSLSAVPVVPLVLPGTRRRRGMLLATNSSHRSR